MRKVSTPVAFAIIIVAAVILIGAIYLWQSKTDQYLVLKITPTSIPQSQTIGWKTYANSEYGFSFEYPSDWNFHATPAGASVLTKQHDESQSPSGKAIDFSVSACKLSEQSCVNDKQDLDQQIQFYSSTQNTALSVAGKIGHQWVMAGAGYVYTGAIEANGILYVLHSSVNEYETRYPSSMSDSKVKTIFDSFKFVN